MQRIVHACCVLALMVVFRVNELGANRDLDASQGG